MSTCDISKYEWSISIFEHFMTKFHKLPEQPSYPIFQASTSFFSCAGRFLPYLVANPEDRFSRDEAEMILK